MTQRPPESLRRRLLWRLGALVSLVLLLGAAITFALARHFAHGVIDQWLFDSASTLATQIKATEGQARVDLPQSAIETFEFDAVDRVFYDVVTAEGQRIFGNAVLPAVHELPPGGAPVFYDAAVQGEAIRVVAIGLWGPNGKSDAVTVQVAETTNKRDALVVQILLSTLLPQVVLLLLAALAIWSAVTTGMKSLDDIVARLAGYRPDRPEPLPVLLVDDDGPGIPETERVLVLERFYRRVQSPGEGTGLGLAIAREIAARHGAELRIDSVPNGRGTRVTVTFPAVAS